jgi:hypothetical protein
MAETKGAGAYPSVSWRRQRGVWRNTVGRPHLVRAPAEALHAPAAGYVAEQVSCIGIARASRPAPRHNHLEPAVDVGRLGPGRALSVQRKRHRFSPRFWDKVDARPSPDGRRGEQRRDQERAVAVEHLRGGEIRALTPHTAGRIKTATRGTGGYVYGYCARNTPRCARC